MTVAVDESTTIIGPREPLAGWDAIEKVMESPSVSEPLRAVSYTHLRAHETREELV